MWVDVVETHIKLTRRFQGFSLYYSLQGRRSLGETLYYRRSRRNYDPRRRQNDGTGSFRKRKTFSFRSTELVSYFTGKRKGTQVY